LVDILPSMSLSTFIKLILYCGLVIQLFLSLYLIIQKYIIQVVDASLAKEMFSENRFKTKQIPSIAEKSKSGKKILFISRFVHIKSH
jgi:hypothetical protein